MIYTLIESPIGDLLATSDGSSITALFTPGHGRTPAAGWVRDDGGFADLRGQLGEYFAGTRREFDLALHPVGSAFQEAVWKALREIEYGRTESYGQLAIKVGAPAAARAVGAANARNPISIVVPCHRVIGANGTLTGYAGGIDAKRWLLAHEQANLAARDT